MFSFIKADVAMIFSDTTACCSALGITGIHGICRKPVEALSSDKIGCCCCNGSNLLLCLFGTASEVSVHTVPPSTKKYNSLNK